MTKYSKKVNEYPFAPYLFRPNQDQFTKITRTDTCFYMNLLIMEQYVTTTYRLHEVHTRIQGGYVITTYLKFKIEALHVSKGNYGLNSRINIVVVCPKF